MSDPIDKLSVCEILADIYPTDGEKVVSVERIDKAYEAVLTLPSAQPEITTRDQEIIRCKDCKHADKYCHCSYTTWWNSPYDFCSRAERREE